MRPAKTDQTAHRRKLIRVLAGTLLIAKKSKHLHADSDDSDQPVRMRRLIWVFSGRACNLAGNAVPRYILCFSGIKGLWKNDKLAFLVMKRKYYFMNSSKLWVLWPILYINQRILSHIKPNLFTLNIRTASLSKQCRNRSDAAERGVWSVSTLFAAHPALLTHINR